MKVKSFLSPKMKPVKVIKAFMSYESKCSDHFLMCQCVDVNIQVLIEAEVS